LVLKFEDFPVEQVAAGFKPPALATKHQKLYRTRIREAAKQSPNFGGHYVIESWGCGTGCIDFVVVDRVSGRVFDPPFTDVSFHQPRSAEVCEFAEKRWWCLEDYLTFKSTSSLLVVQGCVSEKRCGRFYFQMTSDGLKEIKFQPDVAPDGTVAE
jgi:hypothetical protein